MATVTTVDTDRVWFKAAYGLKGVAQTGRDACLSTSAILSDAPLVITDTRHDALTRIDPMAAEPTSVRFYAAAPITTPDGHRFGADDVLDTRPSGICPMTRGHLAADAVLAPQTGYGAAASGFRWCPASGGVGAARHRRPGKGARPGRD
ncbi:GAF domain-containing protein [Streptomyces sp. NPDC086554]|uniref:GAF domain-containing protein n=1 Tax=Streptomyces sp. NPDC086554 TaxID=3154864 RepID=UPI0034426083